MAAKADIIREVLGELFALGSGQTPSTEDSTWVEQRINLTLAGLAKRNIIYIADDESVDDDAFDSLVTYLAEVCSPKFGRPRDKAAMMQAQEDLRTIQRIGKGTSGILKMPNALAATRTRRWYR